MIVECSKCETRFQLEESRVPPGGIRVRCSRCKEAFFLQHPCAEGAAVIDSSSTRTAADWESALVSDGSIESFPESVDLEEEDWEFNQEPPGEDTGDSGQVDGVEVEPDRLESVEQATDPASDNRGGSLLLPDLGLDDGLSEDAGLEGGSGLDLADDASSGGEANEAEGEIDLLADDPDSDFGEAADFSSLLDDLEDEEFAEPAAAGPARGALESSEEPENWDFFSDASESSRASASLSEVATEFDANALPQQSGLGSQPRVLAARPASGLRACGRALGWLATLALCALGVARGVFPVDSPRSTVAAVDLGGFRTRAVRTTWLETSRSSRLYVVNAELVNETDRAAMVGASIQVALLSRHGERLELPAAPAGVPLAEQFLRELPRGVLVEAATAATAQLATTPLAPGQAVEVQAFFENVPDEAVSFRIERIVLSSDAAMTTRSFAAAPGEPDPTKLP